MYEEGYIEVTGGRVWYQKFNKNTTGTPVIILHGGPGSSSYSLEGLQALQKDRPVILYDQLGCGRSDRPSDKSLWQIDRFVEELALIREALNLDVVHILGHSWGTTLAAAYCLTKPSGVKSVVFSSPCLSAPRWEQDQIENLKTLPREVQETITRCEKEGTTDSEEFKAAIKEFNKRFVCRVESEPDPEWVKKGSGFRNPEIYNIMWGPSEFSVKGNLKSFDCTSRLHEITCPILFTCGRYDEATPESTEYFRSLVSNGKIHVFENSAHMPYFEEKVEYLKVVGNFFKTVELD